MDAISFVMGEKTQPLRAKRMSDLIHGASVGKPISNRAHVTAVFETENGTEKKFQRSIIGSSADHKIDDQSVTGIHKLLYKVHVSMKFKYSLAPSLNLI